MNIYQKAVLALGAVALLVYFLEKYNRGIELSFVLGIIGITLIVFVVLRNMGKE
jgi:hypothetical protein